MADTTPSSPGAMPETGSPETGTPASSGVTPQMKPTATLEEALAKIAELEHAHKNAREQADRQAKKLSTYEQAEEQAKLAALSEVEKANKRAQDAEKQIQQYKDQIVLEKVINAAHKKGIIDPELAALAVKGNLEYGDDGMPSNLDKALDELIKAKPYLVPKADEPAPASPAQTARRAPMIPAMNPERSSIASPGQNTPGRIPRLTDPGLWKS